MPNRPSFFPEVYLVRDVFFQKTGKQVTFAVHMAHRTSWHAIELMYTDFKSYILNRGQLNNNAMGIMNILIPHRNFGNILIYDTSYYHIVVNGIIKGIGDPNILKIINSSPFNLRPGIGSENMSIGAKADNHIYNGSLTPQSRASNDPVILAPFNLDSDRTSDFMTMSEFTIFDNIIASNYHHFLYRAFIFAN